MKIIYRIETTDGVVVRQKATRPYVAGFIFREGGKVNGNKHLDFTTRPKYPIGFVKRWDEWNEQATYEKLVAIPIQSKAR